MNNKLESNIIEKEFEMLEYMFYSLPSEEPSKEYTNVSLNEIKNNFYVSNEKREIYDWFQKLFYTEDYRIYLFFPETEGIEFRVFGNLVNFYINLKEEDYGLPEEEELSRITKEINDLFEFDIKRFFKYERIPDFVLNYKPTGKEKYKGVCEDAGNEIRKTLNKKIENGELPQNLRYFAISGRFDDNEWGHDLTLVVNITNGKWIVLNSKRPINNDYTILPLEVIKKELINKNYKTDNRKII